eukprot:TRINITY_DN94764_c0_g1_i1.p1 TRINITY_DN94764_c0_g1~~TRINITY_DN94764_c0_g1_i1.p1  ORF type:complete len:236 (-),score=50.05 TRINITY_DN94764_c0_g1_i1:57-689(-)
MGNTQCCAEENEAEAEIVMAQSVLSSAGGAASPSSSSQGGSVRASFDEVKVAPYAISEPTSDVLPLDEKSRGDSVGSLSTCCAEEQSVHLENIDFPPREPRLQEPGKPPASCLRLTFALEKGASEEVTFTAKPLGVYFSEDSGDLTPTLRVKKVKAKQDPSMAILQNSILIGINGQQLSDAPENIMKSLKAKVDELPWARGESLRGPAPR